MSSKGLTPVIATVLLITISVGATASAFTFLNSVQEETQKNWEANLNQQQLEDQSEINIEYVYNSSDNFTLMTVRNTGSISIAAEEDGKKIWNLFIDGRPLGGGGTGWEYTDSSYDTQDLVIIDPQQTITLNTTRNFPLQGQEMWIKISGPYKTSDSYVCYNSGGSSC